MDGYRASVSQPNTSHLAFSLNQTLMQELRNPESLVIPISSHPNALSPHEASFTFPTQVLQDPLLCQSHIRDELSAVLGFHLPSMVIAVVAASLMVKAERMDAEAASNGGVGNDMLGGYYFRVAMETVNPNEIVDAAVSVDQILFHFPPLQHVLQHFAQEDGLLGEQVTNRTSTTAIEKLKAGRFVADEKEELGSCSICLEEMCGGGKELVGLPCQHVFHENCILQWLEKTNSCPLCRATLL